MKKIYCLLMILSFALILTACGKKDGAPDAPKQPEKIAYLGATYVTFQGQEYKTDSIQVELDIQPADNGYLSTLSMYKVKFVPQMPLTIDIDVPNIPSTYSEGICLLQADSIVPTMGGNPVERYMARDISGKASADSISLSLKFADYPTRYEGKAIR